MITERDLQQAILECMGERDPNAQTCIKMAAYYTILDHLYPQDPGMPGGYSHDSGPADYDSTPASYDSGTEFSKAVKGRDYDAVLSVMDELMETLRVINPRLYDAVMRKLGDL